jgi:hypothetical protein
VDHKNIQELTDLQLTELLKILLSLEAKKNKIPISSIDVSLNITVGDGGEDGRIKWEGSPKYTDWFPKSFVLFQCKATKMTPSKCKSEILKKRSKQLQPRVEEVFDANGSYILFYSKSYGPTQKNECIRNFREAIKEAGKPYSETVDIKIYDSNQISEWVNMYIPAVTAVCNWTKKPLPANFQTWESWNGYQESKFVYVPDETINGYINQLRDFFTGPKKIARITGLSGLGKTRLALEVFRPPESLKADPDQQVLSNQVVYTDAETIDPSLLTSTVMELRSRSDSGILVIDNCDLSLHQNICREINHINCNFSILTLDFNPDEKCSCETITLKPVSDDVIKGIITQFYNNAEDPDISRIVSFSMGFPQMAVLLSEARLSEDQNVGNLTDNALVSKLLWGRRSGKEIDRTPLDVISACSLFKNLGFTEDVALQRNYVAEKICNISPDEFYENAQRFIKRGILDKRNRFVRVVPLPLAIRLASDWWEKCSPERAKRILTDDMPSGLAEALCDQMSKLQFLPEAQKLTRDLCGDSAPFGQAKVLNSEKGSRLFRSLVEVNPQASVEALERVFGNCTKEQLLKVGPGRRNLILALEKLCFWEKTFPIASRIMLSFAASENENWGNNATNQFLQLFYCVLSGTQAPPNLRLEVIDEALRSNDIDYKVLAVKALGHSLCGHHFCRIAGAECQGSLLPQKEWRPELWSDVFDYWRESLKRLVSLGCENNQLATLARKQISDNIRSLVQHGLMDDIEVALTKISKERNIFWPDAYNEIEESIIYEGPNIPDRGLQRLNKWKEILKPLSINERLKLIVSIPSHSFEKSENGHFIDLSENKAVLLAKECSEDIFPLLEHLNVLFEGEQRNGYVFGYTLGEKLDSPKIFVEESLHIMKKIDPMKVNPSVLGGFLSAIKPNFPKLVEKTLDDISQDETLYNHTIYLTRCTKPKQKDLNRILKLVKLGKVKVSDLRNIGLSHESPETVIHFSDELTQFDHEGLLSALEILFLYTKNEAEKFEACKGEMRKILMTPGIICKFDRSSTMDEYYLSESLKIFLFNTYEDQELAIFVSNEIISACAINKSLYLLKHFFEPTIKELLLKYKDVIWPIFSKGLLSENFTLKYNIIHLFDPLNSPKDSSTGILSELPPDFLLEWCRQESEKAPVLLARMVPIFLKNEDSWSLHPLAKLLIDNFGYRPDVLLEIDRNLGTFSWIGSVIPYYEKQINIMEQLSDHTNYNVRKWANKNIKSLRKKIASEKKTEEEQDLGIF